MDRTTWAADDAREQADALSLRLHGAASLLRLAAFAGEARRVLGEIDEVLQCRPRVRDELHEQVSQPTAWAHMADTTGDALTCISQMVEQAQGDFTALAYDLAAQLSAQDKARAALDAAAAH